jgi:hypothetical protein
MVNDKYIFTEGFEKFYKHCVSIDFDIAERYSLKLSEVCNIEKPSDMFILIGALSVTLKSSFTALQKISEIAGAKEEFDEIINMIESVEK